MLHNMDWDDHLGISFSEMVQNTSYSDHLDSEKTANLNAQVSPLPSVHTEVVQQVSLELRPLKALQGVQMLGRDQFEIQKLAHRS